MIALATENTRRKGFLYYKLLMLGFLVVLAAGLSGYYYYAYWRETPRYALWQMVRAIQANDTEALFQHIDLQAVAENLVEKSAGDLDFWLQQKGLGAAPEEDDISRLTRSLTKKFARFITPKVIAALEPQIKTGVEKYLAELNTMDKAALAAIPAKAEIHQQNGIAAVTLTDPQSGQTFNFRMAKPPENGKWRVVEIRYQDLRAILERKIKD